MIDHMTCTVSSFDFEAAVRAPFRMQPGLRRAPDVPGPDSPVAAPQLTLLRPGSPQQREKLAVLSAFWPQALLAQSGFDAAPALRAVCELAAHTHPLAWHWDGRRAHAKLLGTACCADGKVEQMATGQFGLGDEVARCLAVLPAPWRLTGLLSLSFCEDLAIIDGPHGTLPWLAVTLPSHWAPEEKLGLPFHAVHAPVADNQQLLQASAALLRLVYAAPAAQSESQRSLGFLERFVWNITAHPRLHAHPQRVDPERWRYTPVAQSWFRSERQSFIQVPGLQQSVFTIEVGLQPLVEVLNTAARARLLAQTVASMSEAVLRYRGLHPVRQPLLDWLHMRAANSF